MPNVLVIEDDPVVREQLSRLYEQSGYKVEALTSAEAALAQLAQGSIDFVITDIKLPGKSGAELIALMQESYPDVRVIAITGYLDIETAIKVLKCGAVDFVVNPFDLTAVHDATVAALERSRVYVEIRHLRRALKNGSEFGNMLSKTPEMHRLFASPQRRYPPNLVSTTLSRWLDEKEKQFIAQKLEDCSGNIALTGTKLRYRVA